MTSDHPHKDEAARNRLPKLDHLEIAYRAWLESTPGDEAKAAWLNLAKQCRRRGLPTRNAADLVLRLQKKYQDLPQ